MILFTDLKPISALFNSYSKIYLFKKHVNSIITSTLLPIASTLLLFVYNRIDSNRVENTTGNVILMHTISTGLFCYISYWIVSPWSTIWDIVFNYTLHSILKSMITELTFLIYHTISYLKLGPLLKILQRHVYLEYTVCYKTHDIIN